MFVKGIYERLRLMYSASFSSLARKVYSLHLPFSQLAAS